MKRFGFLLLILFFGTAAFNQDKPPLDFSVYDGWKALSSQAISDDGDWVSYEINPSVGDGWLYLHSLSGGQQLSFARGDAARLSANNDFLVFRIKPFADTVRQKKLDKVKKDEMPKDSLALYHFQQEEMKTWPDVKSFKIPESGPSVLAYILEEQKIEAPEEPDSAKSEPGEKEKPEKKEKPKKKKYNGADLNLYFTDDGGEKTYPDVTAYDFAEKAGRLAITSIEEDSVNTGRIILLNTETREELLVWEQEGVTQSLSGNDDMSQLLFLHSADTTDEKVFSLYHWTAKKGRVELLADTLTVGMPAGWCVATSAPRFSKDGSMVFLQTREKPEQKKEEKDSLLADEKVHLDIWHWKDVVLQSMQLKQVGRAKNRSFQAVIMLKNKQFIQLGEEEGIENYSFARFGQTQTGLGLDEKPYEWENAIRFESRKDVYLYELKDESRKKIFEGVTYRPALSEFGNFLYWWEPQDSNYYAYEIKTGDLRCLTEDLPVSFAIDNNDYPEDTRSWGSMGWTAQDRYLLLYDKYDVWKVDPRMEEGPVCLTQSYGRDQGVRLRYARTDREEDYPDLSKTVYFEAFHYLNKQQGYYRVNLENGTLDRLVMGDYALRLLSRPKGADKLLWTRSTVSEYPELHVSDGSFGAVTKLTETNPQQGDYNWMTVELVEWRDFEGVMHQGLLYKPENFDPQKTYPMMVYFYRLHSDGLHSYIAPRASYSTINAAFYASNGYLVFMPDVFFKIGQPGKSAFNSVVSGVMALGKEREYIDMDHLGIQGQSWGGYQTAYIITQTDLFAAASPGAPVSNMTSAYGGIRTSSGMCRQVQYEKGQSRIGGSLWEKPLEYFENSPLFYADDCQTPCLIRHNDNDGAVPFAQGVEFFVALRRLGKPAWLLNYNDGPHNLTEKLANRKDLSVRMKQFFDHYLKGEPAPEWLTVGVEAVDKKQNETYYLNFVK